MHLFNNTNQCACQQITIQLRKSELSLKQTSFALGITEKVSFSMRVTLLSQRHQFTLRRIYCGISIVLPHFKTVIVPWQGVCWFKKELIGCSWCLPLELHDNLFLQVQLQSRCVTAVQTLLATRHMILKYAKTKWIYAVACTFFLKVQSLSNLIDILFCMALIWGQQGPWVGLLSVTDCHRRNTIRLDFAGPLYVCQRMCISGDTPYAFVPNMIWFSWCVGQ